MKFFVDAADVRVHSGQFDAELVGDFFVEITVGKQLENLIFARGQFGHGCRLRLLLRLLKSADDLAGDVRRHGRTAGVNLPERGKQIGARGLFEQIAGRPGLERLKNVVGILVDGDHHKLRLGQQWLQLADTFGAVHSGEVDVHEHDFRAHLGQRLQGVLAGTVVAGADKLLRSVDPADEQFTRFGVVFHH